jgi:hypothetical protein
VDAFDELVEGAGGTLNHLAALVADHIGVVSAETEDGLQLLHCVLDFLQDARYFGLLSCPVPFVATGMILAAIDAVGTVITVGRADAPTVFELCLQVVGWGVCGVLPRLRRAFKAGLLRAILLCRAASVDVQEVRRLLTRELPGCSIHYHVLHQMLISLREVDDLATSPAFTSSPVFEEWTNLVDLASSGELSWIMLIPKIIHCIGHATTWR